jgi:hypothetical protein
MSGLAWKTKVLPGLLAGTERMPLKLDDVGTLAALSLTGQALRFTRPAGPAEFMEEDDVVDERRILPNAIRKPLIWLLKGRRVGEDAERALAWNFARLRLRPHPFDMPRMAGFVKAFAEALGTTAEHWASRDGKAATPLTRLLEDDALDEANWRTTRPAARVRFVGDRRKNNPAEGLELVRAAWGSEDAEMRLRLLEALLPQLREADREFIVPLLKDRGTRVRALAQRMIYRLDGFTGDHPALRECLSRITTKTEGPLRKRTVFSLEIPATVKEHTLKGWIRETFAEVSCEELARGLKTSEEQMVESSGKDANLLLALALMATADRRFDLLDEAVKKLPDAWEQMTQCGWMGLEIWVPPDRLRWARSLTSAYGAHPPFSMGAWRWMHRALLGPLPVECVESALRSRAWREKLFEVKGPEWPDLLVACCPPEAQGALQAVLGEMEPAHTAGALALLAILDAMERG